MPRTLKLFFSGLLFTTLIPYIPSIFPFLPDQVFGFNLTGWAWILMLGITVVSLFQVEKISFPIYFWLPWIIYLLIYIAIDYSFLGLQLTSQYLLPILIGIVVSGFRYSPENFHWLMIWFGRLCLAIYFLFVIGYLFRGGYGPFPAITAMLFSILASIISALWYLTRDKKYLIYMFFIFLPPVLQVTRMGIAAIAAVFILHFANTGIRSKILYGTAGILAFLLVFGSKPFQEKTFHRGSGSVTELSLNYYENPQIKSSGRVSWKKALDPGLRNAPLWGNGPRSENAYLVKITKMKSGEAHNDYLAVRYNYGYVGLSMLLLGFGATFLSLLKLFRKHKQNEYFFIICTSVLTLFFAFLMFMYTDNILKYTVYFPNYFFALIGIVYSLKQDEDIRSSPVI